MVIPELRGITTVYATHRVQQLALNYNSFILTVAIIGVGIYSIEAGGYNVFDSHARDMYHNSHSEGSHRPLVELLMLWKPTKSSCFLEDIRVPFDCKQQIATKH